MRELLDKITSLGGIIKETTETTVNLFCPIFSIEENIIEYILTLYPNFTYDIQDDKIIKLIKRNNPKI